MSEPELVCLNPSLRGHITSPGWRLELEAVPITVEAWEGSTGEESGVKLEAPGMPETLLFVGGGLIPPTGGGGSIPRPPPVLPFAALALSLLGMLMFTLMV